MEAFRDGVRNDPSISFSAWIYSRSESISLRLRTSNQALLNKMYYYKIGPYNRRRGEY